MQGAVNLLVLTVVSPKKIDLIESDIVQLEILFIS